MRKEDLPVEIKAKLLEIATAMSPENLTCDGELSSSEVERKFRKLEGQWAKIVKQYDVKISYDEAFAFHEEHDQLSDLSFIRGHHGLRWQKT